MDRSDRMMTGIFPDSESADRAYACVLGRGYTDREVSLLISDESRARYFPPSEPKTELGTKAAQGAGVGLVAGAGIGALLAGLAAAGVAVPGLPIIAIGPLAAAFAGGGTGGALGAIVGALIGRGIPEERAKLYERGINEGGIVLGVTPRTEADADYFEREWSRLGGTEIYRPSLYEAGRRV